MSKEIKDFTVQRENPVFTIAPDTFYGVVDLPALAATDFMHKAQEFNTADLNEKREILRGMFELILVPESAEIFYRRLDDKENPIGISTMNNVIEWLMEQYGLVPTQQQLDSLNGSNNPESGTASTELVSVTESISLSSP